MINLPYKFAKQIQDKSLQEIYDTADPIYFIYLLVKTDKNNENFRIVFSKVLIELVKPLQDSVVLLHSCIVVENIEKWGNGEFSYFDIKRYSIIANTIVTSDYTLADYCMIYAYTILLSTEYSPIEVVNALEYMGCHSCYSKENVRKAVCKYISAEMLKDCFSKIGFITS